MKRILPNAMYRRKPCSVVAVGCALGASSDALTALTAPELRSDGYLTLDGMNRLIRAHMAVKRRFKYSRGDRPTLREFCHAFSGRAIVCVTGHYVYVEGGDYYSFFYNGKDEVISAWILED